MAVAAFGLLCVFIAPVLWCVLAPRWRQWLCSTGANTPGHSPGRKRHTLACCSAGRRRMAAPLTCIPTRS